MREMVDRTMAPQRFNMALLAVFGSASLVLAAIGIFGVMAQAVSQRTHEIGIRIALGADRGEVLRLVVGRGLLLVGAGVAAGLIAARLMAGVMSSLLFGVSATDLVTFGAVAMVLAFVALAAAWLPAGCATLVDPIVALRYE